MHKDILRIKSFIEAGDCFSLICHVSPDGDTLGSALALYGLINKLGKKCEVVCADEIPPLYRFMQGAEEVKSPDKAKCYPYIISVDCADAERMGAAKMLFDNAKHTANIDHHGTNVGYAQDNCVNCTAACGELIYELIRSFDVVPDKGMAECLYTALMTDTGSFAYSNVTPDTMRIAGELIGFGANNAEINMHVYRNVALSKAKMHAYAMTNAKLYAEGKIAVAHLSSAEIDSFGAEESQCDGIVENLRDISTVEISVFVKQSGENAKVSLRAKRCADVSRIASKKQGGGHERAAGYTEKNCTVEEAAKIAAELAKEELELCLKA